MSQQQQVTNRDTVHKKPTPKYILGFSTVNSPLNDSPKPSLNESPKTSSVTTSNESSKPEPGGKVSQTRSSLGGHGAVNVKDSLNKPMIKEVYIFIFVR